MLPLSRGAPAKNPEVSRERKKSEIEGNLILHQISAFTQVLRQLEAKNKEDLLLIRHSLSVGGISRNISRLSWLNAVSGVGG